VLTSVVEIKKEEYLSNVRNDVNGSNSKEILIFVHGYNVSVLSGHMFSEGQAW
jgi:esterase/lipase superfamily enzyme